MSQEEVIYKRNPDYIYRKIVDEAVLVPIQKQVADMDCIYTMNPVGAFIWEWLEKPATQADLQAALLEEYDTDLETVVVDLEAFLQDLVTIGAIQKV